MSNQLTADTGNLWALQGQLFEMYELREELLANAGRQAALLHEAEIKDPTAWHQAEAELAAIEKGIYNYVIEHVKEVDTLRDPLLALETGVAICKAAAARETNRAITLQNRYDKLKDFIKQAMEALEASGYWKPKQSKKLESARGFFRLQGNGGNQPVEITDETLIPAGLLNYTITLPGDLWIAIERAIGTGPLLDMIVHRARVSKEPSKSRIAKALAQPCGQCGGVGTCNALTEGDVACSECGGSGTAGVPGARLAPRGNSVIISK